MYDLGFYKELDLAIETLIGQCLNLKKELSTFNKIQIHGPICLGGLEVRELNHVRYAEFIGGIMDVIPLYYYRR